MGIILSLIVPALVSCYDGCFNKLSKRIALQNLFFVELLANGIIGIRHLCGVDFPTIYELLLVNVIISLFAELILSRLIREKNVSCNVILITIALSSIAVASYSILTYGRTIIHSDTATATILAESIIKHKSWFPASWNYANGDIWVIGFQFFTILPMLLFQDQSLARMVGSLILVILTCWAVFYQSKKIFKDNSWTMAVAIVFVFLFGHFDMQLYQAAYIPTLLYLSLCTTLLCEIYREDVELRQKKNYIVAYSIVMIFLTMGGIRWLAEQTVPAVCTCAVMSYLDLLKDNKMNNTKIRNLLYTLAIIIISSAIGFGIYKWLCIWHNVNNTVNNSLVFVGTLEDIFNNIEICIRNFFSCFGFSGNSELFSMVGIRNFISIGMCGILCFIVPFLQFLKFKEEKETVQIFYVFVLIHNLIMITLIILFGKTADRYILSSIYGLILVSARYIYAYWIDQKNIVKNLWILFFTFATIIECIPLYKQSTHWVKNLENKKEFVQVLLNHGLTKGYATYWNAYSNEVYSNLKIKFSGVNITDHSLSPYLWLSDSNTYIPEENIKTFLLLSEEENKILGKNIELIGGLPIDVFRDCNMHVYVFDHDIASDFSGNALRDNILKPIELSLTENGGKVSRDQIEIYPSGTVFGPYVTMDQGAYVVTFKGKNFKKGHYDIYTHSDGDKLSYKEIKRTDKEIVVRMILSDKTANLEFRVRNDSKENIILNEISVIPDDFFEKFKLNQEYKFKEMSNLGHGFSGIEPWGVWTDGRQAKLKLNFDEDIENDVLVEIVGHPFLNKDNKQKITVYVDGEQVAHWKFKDDASDQRFVFKIAKKHINENSVQLKFKIKYPTTPASKNINSDERALGFGFVSIKIKAEE